MSTTFSVGNWRNQVVNAITGATVSSNQLASGGTIQIRTGSQPAGPDTAVTGTLLATYTLSAGSMSAGSVGASQLAAAIQATAAATGTAGYARWLASGTAVIDGTVGVSGSGAAFILDSLSISASGITTLQACSLRMPQGASTLKLNAVARNRLVDIFTQTASAAGRLDLGRGGTLSLYTGSQPSTPDSPATGTLLATIPMGSSGASCYAASSGGSAALSGNQSVNAVASGTVGWVRWANGSYIFDGSAGNVGTEDFVLDSATTTSGNAIAVTNATITY